MVFHTYLEVLSLQFVAQVLIFSKNGIYGFPYLFRGFITAICCSSTDF